MIESRVSRSNGMPRVFSFALASAALLAAGAAQAQTGTYKTSAVIGTFTEMIDGTPVGITAKTTSANGKTVQLGFPFIFYGQSYTEVYVNSLGQVLFGGTSNSLRPISSQLGDPAPPNNFVTGWYPERTFSTINNEDTSYKIEGPPGARVATFQWKDWGELWQGGIDDGRLMQIILKEATRTVEIKYGPMRATSSTNSIEYALSGAEGPNGANPLNLLACNTNGTSSRGCRKAQWPTTGTTLSMTWITPEADLVPLVEVTGVRPVSINGLASLEVDLKVTIENLGNTAANNVVFDIYTSTDHNIDPATDDRVGVYGTPTTIPERGSTTVNTQVVVPRPAGGLLHIGVDVDPGGAVNDSARHNNRGVSLPFMVGVDLVALSVTGPAKAGLGDTVTLNVGTENMGTDPVTATYGIYLSTDAEIDPETDVRVGEAQITLGGFERKSVSITGQVPNNFYINAPELHWGVYADPAGDVTSDVARDNNGKASIAKWQIVLPDLTADTIELTSTEYYFGEFVSVSADIKNVGEADGHNVSAWVVLSNNPSITLSDHKIAQIDHITVPRNGKVRVNIDNIRIPLYGPDGVTPYQTGNYSFGIIVDPLREVPESSEVNNGKPFLPEVIIRQPAPDLVAARVDGPASASGGEVVPVSRLIRNIGNRGNDLTGKAYRYQYFLSENDVISVQDRLLPILIDGQEKTFGSGRLPVGGEDRGVDHVRMPENLPAGDYFLGMMVDATDEIVELDETNNIVASGGLVRIVGSGLEISTTWLPDATERTGYLRQLVARGGDGTYQWSILPGRGELPKGVTLTSDGMLSGRPERIGNYEFVVQVRSGGLSAMAQMVLRVFAPTGALQIATQSLPLGIEGRAYGDTGTETSGVTLVASGGVPPYQWRLLGNTVLPNGMAFSNGTLSGEPAAGTGGDYALEVELNDAAGGVARQTLPFKVIQPTTLAIQSSVVPPDGVAGGTYTLALPVVGAQGGLKVAVTAGAIPEGLQLSTGSDRVFLLGTPVRPAAYQFVLTVTDDSGATASRALMVIIAPRTIGVFASSGSLADAKPGEVYDTYLSTDATTKVTYRLAGGSLPPGLVLEEAGAIRGTVPEGTPGRAWDFLVEVRDQNGGQGVAPFSIYVIPAPLQASAPPQGVGCAASPGSVAPAGLLALAALLRRGGGRRNSAKEE